MNPDMSEELKPEENYEVVMRFTAAMREADKSFETIGGSTRHYVRDCLFPILRKHGIEILLKST